jgi:hypothetical protein
MTDTAVPDETTSPVSRPVVVTPPKLQWRPATVVVGTLLVLAGGLGVAWGFVSAAQTVSVLAATSTIERGALIEAGDLARVEVRPDPLLRAMPGQDLSQVVGLRAALDIAAGSVVTADAVTGDLVPPEGESVVWVPLATGAEHLVVGDAVRVVVSPPDREASDAPVFQEGQVAMFSTDPATGQATVGVQLPHAQAVELASALAGATVSVVLDSREP